MESRTSLRMAWYGAIGAQMAMPPLRVRRYFPYEKVKQGVLDLTAELTVKALNVNLASDSLDTTGTVVVSRKE